VIGSLQGGQKVETRIAVSPCRTMPGFYGCDGDWSMVEKAPEFTPTIHEVRVSSALEKYRFSTVKSAE